MTSRGGAGLREESRATSGVAALSVVVAVIGHVLAGSSPVPLTVVPPLLALTAVCWLLGEHLAEERLLAALVLTGVQLFVHVTLDATHHSLPMQHGPMPRGINGSLSMTAAHLAVVFAGVLLINRTSHWAQRVLRILARLVPQLPVIAALPVRRYAAPLAVPLSPRLVRRWLSSNVSRRGPPVLHAVLS